MRITNIDTLSNYFDRLITENIKLYFFTKEKEIEKIEHQQKVISEIKFRLAELFAETIKQGKYEYISEHRTFNESAIIEELEDLIRNDINIGEADRARLDEAKKEFPNIERLVVNEKRLRKANEGRARNKNNIDIKYKNTIE
jgi:hypothetical protein